MVILSVDYGRVRTGIAVCDKDEIIASPVEVIKEVRQEVLAEKISMLCRQKGAEQIVLGLPKNMDGTEGESALNVRAFSEILQTVTGLPVVLQDERGTTVTAYGYLDRTNTYGKKRKAIVDSVAAVIILEDYLRYRRNGL
ncbi:MAG: Holliday junction resolvase RuvX [Clostridia bacterium]|nr:Holliday junction resolvase RuvX [Clostridia bacterium]HCA55315.1 Holliday junction resolvase RuvX [Oscillospiraceae bacterium]